MMIVDQTAELEQLSARLLDGVVFEQQTLTLALGHCTIAVRANSVALLSRLRDYFSHIVIPRTQSSDIDVLVVESESIQLPVNFQDWQREPGKTGRKESVYDLDGGRLIHKVRTGMLFLQSAASRIAIGPCLENDNQIINFINNQYMTWLQQRGWLNCHAAALVKDGFSYAVAGFSGGGKSTLMLQMLEDESTSFLSNDRLFIHAQAQQVQATGVPKMPRINPGTIVNNPRLESMMTQAERESFLALPKQALWDLEQKYDVDIEAVYGNGRILNAAPLKSFLVLNWERETAQPLQLKKVQLRQRTDLLLAIMKAPGPFYQQVNGQFVKGTEGFNQAAYLDVLDYVDVFEVTGQVDFALLAKLYLQQQET